MNRVVITGAGVVSALGMDLDTNLNSLYFKLLYIKSNVIAGIKTI